MAGSNFTVSAAAAPGFNVSGNVAPENVKPAPVATAALTVTGALPVELRVAYFVTAEFTTTLPNERSVALTLNVGVDEFNCRANVLDTLLALAVIVAVCAEVTGETLAVNPTLIALAGTVTEPGTITAELLLPRLTLIPLLGAAPLKVTVQVSVPDPVIDALAHEIALSVAVLVAVPVPLRLINSVGFAEELLEIVSWPVAELAVFGSNCTLSVTA